MATTARRGKTTGIPFRQTHKPRAVCSLIGPDSAWAAAHMIASRVQSIGKARGCCAFVFLRDGSVYVISEEASSAHEWSKSHIAEWVGCYGGLVDVGRLVEDLVEHLASR